jgi:hypothetical protein
MKTALSAASLLGWLTLLLGARQLLASKFGPGSPCPAGERTSVARALPAEPGAAPAPDAAQEPSPEETTPPAQRRLEYADALFGRKLYDLSLSLNLKSAGLLSHRPVVRTPTFPGRILSRSEQERRGLEFPSRPG